LPARSTCFYGQVGVIGLATRIELGIGGAASFYESLGMVKQPRRSAEENLVYTLEAATAEQLLAEIKAKGIVEL